MQILIDPEHDSEEQVIAVMRAARSAASESNDADERPSRRRPAKGSRLKPMSMPSKEELSRVTSLDDARALDVARRKGMIEQ